LEKACFEVSGSTVLPSHQVRALR